MTFHPLLLCNVALVLVGCGAGKNVDDVVVVGGYLPDYRFDGVNLQASVLSMTDLMLFSIQPTDDGRVEGEDVCCLGKQHFTKAREARAYKKEVQPSSDLRLLLTVGGGQRSDTFTQFLDDAALRKKFLENLKNLCLQEELDGIDLDVENPQVFRRPSEYFDLIREASVVLHDAGLLLTLAIHVDMYFPQVVYDSVDRVHLMTYDLTPSLVNDDRPYHHADFDEATEKARRLHTSGLATNKICLGIPAYGRFSRPPYGAKTYAELVDDFLVSHPPDMKVLEATRIIDGHVIDSPGEVRRKLFHAVEKSLVGVFFWEIGQDKQHPVLGKGGLLLQAAASAAAEAEKFSGAKEEL